MACSCKNDDGTLMDRCLGICKESIVHHTEEQERDPVNGFVEMIMDRVDTLIYEKMKDLRIKFEKDQYKIYLEGIKDGVSLGREIYE